MQTPLFGVESVVGNTSPFVEKDECKCVFPFKVAISHDRRRKGERQA